MKAWLVGALILSSSVFFAQTGQVPIVPVTPQLPAGDFTSNHPADTPTSMAGQDYRIGPDDLVDISVFEIAELSTAVRVSATGIIPMPFIGTVTATGKTSQELSRSIEDALRGKWVNDPHVTVFVREYASQPVSVIGAVRFPGQYQLKGQKYLLDVLSQAQGLTETAGKTILIMRRKPVVEGDTNPTSENIAINVEDLMQNGNPALNVPIKAYDTINVLPAGSIFVVGEIMRPGEFPLRLGRDVTVTQAVSLGGGFTKDAKKSQGLIVRPHADGSKEQIPIDLAKIFDLSTGDVRLMANDVLFVPANKVKAGLSRVLEYTVNIAVGRAIYSGF